MIQERELFTSIDIGTTKICTIISERADSGPLSILGHGVVPSKGINKGNVIDEVTTVEAIRSSISMAEQDASVEVSSAYVGITGSHISFENRISILDWVGKNGVITRDDLNHVPSTIANSMNDTGKEIIHALPIAYSLDGEYGIKDPMGMHSSRLEVQSHVVTASPSLTRKLVQSVENAGVKVESLVLQPLASGASVLTKEEKNLGVALVDIGGGTTDVIVYREGSVCFSSVIPVGGIQFTNDISLTYDTSQSSAEDAKLKYANTEPETIGPEEHVRLNIEGKKTELKIPRHELCQLTKERAQELVRLIKLKLDDAEIEDLTNYRVVITGGGSILPGLESLIRRMLTTNVRMGRPNGYIENIPEIINTPCYSAGLGILIWASTYAEHEGRNSHENGTGESMSDSNNAITRIIHHIKSVF